MKNHKNGRFQEHFSCKFGLDTGVCGPGKKIKRKRKRKKKGKRREEGIIFSVPQQQQ
jgi:hypothetical protein